MLVNAYQNKLVGGGHWQVYAMLLKLIKNLSSLSFLLFVLHGSVGLGGANVG